MADEAGQEGGCPLCRGAAEFPRMRRETPDAEFHAVQIAIGQTEEWGPQHRWDERDVLRWAEGGCADLNLTPEEWPVLVQALAQVLAPQLRWTQEAWERAGETDGGS